MRIIAGKYGGRRLVSFEADHIRPTTDRVKESIFNKLQGMLEGARVLDLFSGTGNLSFESLSRGAEAVDAVESHRKSLEIIRENQQLLRVGTELKIIPVDVLRYLNSYSSEPYDLVFVDPPFTKKMADQVLGVLAESKAVGPNTWVIIESARLETVKDEYGRDLVRFDSRDFGDKLVSYFCRRSDDDSGSVSG